jgi:hypothetical protein
MYWMLGNDTDWMQGHNKWYGQVRADKGTNNHTEGGMEIPKIEVEVERLVDDQSTFVHPTIIQLLLERIDRSRYSTPEILSTM